MLVPCAWYSANLGLILGGEVRRVVLLEELQL